MELEKETREQLIDEISSLRRRLTVLERESASSSRDSKVQALLDAITETAILMDRDGVVLAANQVAAQRLGRTREGLVGQSLFDLFDAEVARSRRSAVEEVLRTRAPLRVEDRRAGRIYDTNWYPVLGEGGMVKHLAVFAADITERRLAEEALRASEERYRGLVEQMPAGVYEVDIKNRKFLAVNQAAEELTGYTKEEFLALDPLDLVTEPSRDLLQERQRRILAGEPLPAKIECVIRRKDGTERWMLVDARVFHRDQESVKARVVLSDLTELKRLDAHFRQAQRMEAIGTLAGGVAHDFRNVLTVIVGYAELLLKERELAGQVREGLEQIRSAAQRAEGFTSQLLAFSRKQVRRLEVLDVNELIQIMEKMLLRLIREDIELEMALPPGLGAIRADSGQIQQIIMNLVVNARDAMPHGGRLTIETANVELDLKFEEIHGVEIDPGPYLMISVSDTGVGMDRETQARIFEPFFTTKEPGKGTGLGLSTVYGIVKQNNGFVWVYSEPGKGSTFKVYLPRTEEAPESIVVQPQVEHRVQGTETILLAEDEDSVRRLVSRMLGHFGYRVLEASNPGMALELCATHHGPIDLLLTDVIMPGGGGRELAEAVARLRPGTRVLYMSGHTGEVIAHHGILPPEINFIEKPFDPGDLARKIRKMLGEGA
jgi:two-component system, cell cycle sensor histidine kinase and response regulator CckA